LADTATEREEDDARFPIEGRSAGAARASSGTSVARMFQ